MIIIIIVNKSIFNKIQMNEMVRFINIIYNNIITFDLQKDYLLKLLIVKVIKFVYSRQNQRMSFFEKFIFQLFDSRNVKRLKFQKFSSSSFKKSIR